MPEVHPDPSDSYFVWEARSQPVAVLLNVRVLDRLKSWARAGAKTMLLGRDEVSGSGRRLLTVEDFGTPHDGLTPVAAVTTTENGLEPMDKRVIQQQPARGSLPTLVIQHGPEPAAAFFIPREPVKPFRLDAACGVSMRNITLKASRLTLALAAMRRWLLPIGMLFVGVAVWAWSLTHTSERPQTVQPLGLAVYREGQNLWLRWPAKAPPVRGASAGEVRISDGPTNTRMELSPRQLAIGGIVYRPVSSDVDFRMEVKTPSGRAAESVRVLLMPNSPAPAEAESATRQRQAPRHFTKSPQRVVQPATLEISFEAQPESKLRRGMEKILGIRLKSWRNFVAAKPVPGSTPALSSDLARIGPVQGALSFEVSIDDTGLVSNIIPLCIECDARFLNIAVRAMTQTRFEPATYNGNEVPSRLIATVQVRRSQP